VRPAAHSADTNRRLSHACPWIKTQFLVDCGPISLKTRKMSNGEWGWQYDCRSLRNLTIKGDRLMRSNRTHAGMLTKRTAVLAVALSCFSYAPQSSAQLADCSTFVSGLDCCSYAVPPMPYMTCLDGQFCQSQRVNSPLTSLAVPHCPGWQASDWAAPGSQTCTYRNMVCPWPCTPGTTGTTSCDNYAAPTVPKDC